jgi:N-glycosylase/DNA lyase
VIQGRWVRLVQAGSHLEASTDRPVEDWVWLTNYLQTEVELDAILATFPNDEPMQRSVAACRGLRLLRQDPWECLASFILSSTKQIVQIQQICGLLCDQWGEPSLRIRESPWAKAFPTPERLAACSETELRSCKMGFRAPHLLGAARAVANGRLQLSRISHLSLNEARAELCGLRGVGPKIANCVLLFAYGFPTAFPVDVWVQRAIQKLYFPKRKVSEQKLVAFVNEHFGPNGGYAQQYLFHYIRTHIHPARKRMGIKMGSEK